MCNWLFLWECIKRIAGFFFKCITIFSILCLDWHTVTYCRAISKTTLFLFFQQPHLQLHCLHSLDSGQRASEWWKWSLEVVSLYLLIFLCRVGIFSPIKKAACDKWSLTHMLPHLMKKIFQRRGLHLRNCLKRFKEFEAEEERIDVYAASSWVELAQGLIRDQQHTPPRAPAFHSAIGFSLTIQGLIDEPLCISAMHFLKSEKPIHLGQTHKKEGEKEKLQNSFFFSLLASTRLSFTSFQSTPSLIVSGLHICHVPWRQPKLRRNGTLVVPHCTILRVDKFTKISNRWVRYRTKRGENVFLFPYRLD